MFPPKILNSFVSLIERSIDKKGVYPHPVIMQKNKDGVIVCALDLDLDECIKFFLTKIIKNECSSIIMGLDRCTKQGTEFNDVITVFMWQNHYTSVVGYPLHDGILSTGVINYQNEPRIIRPIDYNNDFWNKTMRKEIGAIAIIVSMLNQKG